ncbi:MAG TPA: sulfotransferase [Anaerolineae bacterium]|nr:sulfotransferase [Anaerolineae bacterium]
MKALVGQLATRRFIDSPVFVVGTNRSGTSILLRALGAHPLVWGSSGEAPLMAMLAEVPDRLEHSQFAGYYAENLQMSKGYLYASLRRLCFEYALGANYGWERAEKGFRSGDFSVLKKRYWSAKIFPEESHCRGLRLLFPGLKFVYITRNGIEVVHSRTKFAGFRDLDFEEHCRVWASSFRLFGHLASAQDAILVRHEHLVADAGAVLHEVFDFLGIGADTRPVTLVRTTLAIPLDEHDSVGVDARQILQTRRPPYEGWTPQQRSTFKDIAGDAMIRAGYEIPF